MRRNAVRRVGVLVGAAALIAAGVLVAQRRDEAHPPAGAAEASVYAPTVPSEVSTPREAPVPLRATPAPSAAPAPVDPIEYLENGPKEPLVPPVVSVTIQLAPGETATAAPLIPPVQHTDLQPAPGGSPPSNAPLVPPVSSAHR